MKKVRICLSGCDDNTDFILDLSNEEIRFLDMMAKITKRVSTCNCMPVLRIVNCGDRAIIELEERDEEKISFDSMYDNDIPYFKRASSKEDSSENGGNL